jgi:hypothetical protein
MSRNEPHGPAGGNIAEFRNKTSGNRVRTRAIRLVCLLLPEGGRRMVMVDRVARRVLAEFEEMPGLTLTVRQASRLFGLDEQQCRVVIDALIDSAYLRETRRGVVVRGDRVAA